MKRFSRALLAWLLLAQSVSAAPLEPRPVTLSPLEPAGEAPARPFQAPAPQAGLPELPAAPQAPAAPFLAPQPPQAPEPPSFFLKHDRIARAVIAPFLKAFYRTRVEGLENLPDGPAVIVPNHVSYVDPVLLAYAAKRPVRFVMAKRMYDRWYLKPFAKLAGAIPVDVKDLGEKGPGGGRGSVEATIEAARGAVRAGQSVVIFPEGHLTRNGNLLAFRKGFERIAAGLDAPVVPAQLDHLWGSVFSLRSSQSLWQKLRQARRYAGVSFGPALKEADAQQARLAVQELSADALERRIRQEHETLPLAFLRAAKTHWLKPAVADATLSLTYGKTLAATMILSRRLESKLSASPRVGVLLPPSAGGALANLALARLGRTAVNLNYTTGLDVLKQSMQTAGIDRIVTSRKFVDALKGRGLDVSGLPLIVLEDLPQAGKAEKLGWYALLAALPRRAIAALFWRKAARSMDDEATIVFTSGSTAAPKGAQLTQLNLVSNIEMVGAAADFTSKDAVLGVLPLFHSFGYTVSFWLPLTTGLSVAYHSNPLEAKSIGKLAEKYKPTILLGTPSFLQLYAQKIPAAAFKTLRLVIAGAERLGEAGKAFKEKFGLDVLEGYGATELSPVAAVNVPDRAGQQGTLEGSVGQNLPGTAARVIDEDTGAELPYGKEGLLLIKGPNVMKGYLGMPEKTAEVVRGGWYDTGDLAVIDRAGFIRIKGRASIDFGKVAGEKVPYDEVAQRLQDASGLSEKSFIVTGVPDAQRGTRLVVLYKGEGVDVAALLAKLKAAKVPALWLPDAAAFHRVDEFPMLGTGKLDKKGVLALAKKLEGR